MGNRAGESGVFRPDASPKQQTGIRLSRDAPPIPVSDPRTRTYFAFRLAIRSWTQVSGSMNKGVSMCPSRRFTQISAV